MKRLFSILLVCVLLLSGCAIGQGRMKEPVTFHYLRNYNTSDNYKSFFTEGAMGSEIREAAGHRNDLVYLLSIYLQGPLDPELKRPFPYDCRVVGIVQEDQTLTVKLNAMAANLDEMKLTVACACLAKTVMELTDAETVIIQAIGLDQQPLFSRSFTAENLLLEDSTTHPTEAATDTH